jgi:hypothetical protein
MGWKDKILGLLGLGGPPLPKGQTILEDRGGRPQVPGWAQQDYYAQKDLGVMAPPEELAEEIQHQGGSADFLRTKLDGGARIQQFENSKKNDTKGTRSLGMKDGEIEHYLGGVLQKDPKKK